MGCQVMSTHLNGSRTWPQESTQQLDGGGFSGTVGAKESKQLTGLQVQIEIPHGPVRTVLLGYL